MYFLPDLLFNLDAFTLFGVTVLICLISGELISRTKIFPRISGYIALGFILGPNLLGFISQSILSEMQGIVDISLGLIAFSIGRHLDIAWLKNDKGLLYTGITSFFLTTAIVTTFIIFQGWPFMLSLIAGVIASTTSPAVILMVARDLYSEGPITRRSLIITSLNNLLALISMAMLLPFTKSGMHDNWALFTHSVYRLAGSLLLGLFYFKIMTFIARMIVGKKRELQFLLLVSVIILAISAGKLLNVSSILVLFILGFSARNFDTSRSLMEINFDWLSHLFFIPLFFITGYYFNFSGIAKEPLLVVSFILLRFLSQLTSNLIFTKRSSLTYNQSSAIALALTPMAGIAIGIASKVLDFNPDMGEQLLLIISAAIGILGLFGPIMTQIAFYKSGEASNNIQKVGSNE